MLVVTTDTIPGKTVTDVLGMARGGAARARNVGVDFFAGVKNIVGGEVEQYTKMQAETREQALQRMIDDAERMGANAVLAVRFESSTIATGVSEVYAFGTAVTIE